ncbi:MAG: alpha-galactosidase [Pirellulales bacterium]
MRPILLLFTVVLLAPLVRLQPADAASELMLSRDFRMDNLREMPCSALHSSLRFEQREYSKENAVEWQVRLQAPAGEESPLYEDVKSADFTVRFPSNQGVTLHWNKGSHAEVTDFQPRTEALTPGKPFTLESFGGRSSDGVMPYFNLAAEGGGLIVAVGWSGDWKVSFEALDGGSVRIVAGLKHSRFKLLAGEEVRLLSVLVMSYQGDWFDGQNRFRRLMLQQFTPKSHALMDLMPIAASVHGQLGFNVITEENLAALASTLGALDLPFDTFWLDAGWNEGGFPIGQGNFHADPTRFPHGLAPVGKVVKATGMRFLAWFEPERVMRGTEMEREHSAWLFAPTRTPENLRYMESDGFQLLDLGNEDGRRYALDRISQQIFDADISIYRQDFNEYPAYFWHTDEAPDEVGLREIRHISGLYDFLDELARRHPGLILDNCASGGRRLDFEMMRRCVVLWRSDSCWDAKSFPQNVQAMTHGLSHWLPLHGLGAHTTNDVALRSGMGACGSFPINFHDPASVAALRKHLHSYQRIRPLFMEDFYPLTDWSDDSSKWLAFQFHDPAKDVGIVQAFCGANVSQRSCTLKLQGLDPKKQYTVTDWDNPTALMKLSGYQLNNAGLEVRSHDVDQATVLHYISDPQ